jgi:hypothetical protein
MAHGRKDDPQDDPADFLFRYANPNPDRIGCPGEGVLRALARKELPIDHPARRHLGECSPCFIEFREFLWESRRSRQKRKVVLFALVAAGLLTYWAVHERNKVIISETHHDGAQQSPVVSLILRPGLSRSETTSADKQLLVLPAKPGIVRLLLHLEDDTATLYDVVIQTVEGRDLFRLTGLQKQLTPEHGSAVPVDIQSAAIKPGAYILLLFDHDSPELRNVFNLQVAQ